MENITDSEDKYSLLPEAKHIELPSQNYFFNQYTYICVYCGHKGVTKDEIMVGGDKSISNPRSDTSIYWCELCRCPIYIQNGKQITGPLKLSAPHDIDGLPKHVRLAYNEAQKCMVIGAYTAVAVMCRKVILLIALDKEAVNIADNGHAPSFEKCVNKLGKKCVLPKEGAGVMDNIMRKLGNDAAHQPESIYFSDADTCLAATIAVLRHVYETSA